MRATKAIEFAPDWTSAPGETISDLMEERHMTNVDLAGRLGCSLNELGRLLTGEAMITIDLARQLESVLGGSAAFWMIREAQLRDDMLRATHGLETEAETSEWVSHLPIGDMVPFGWLSDRQLASDAAKKDACLDFFGVPDIQSWHVAYEKVFASTTFRSSTTFES